MNTSRRVSAFSGEGFSGDPAAYPDRNEVIQYLKNYIQAHALEDIFRYNCEVTAIEPCENDQWVCTYYDLCKNIKHSECFSHILICSGKHEIPHLAPVPGLESFTGTVLHSKEYRSPKDFTNKNVLVVGAGASASDIASQTSETANKVYVSIRNTRWIIPRFLRNKPVDYYLNRFSNLLPKSMLSFFLKSLILDEYKKMGIPSGPGLIGLPQPKFDLTKIRLTLNSTFISQIHKKRIVPEPLIRGCHNKMVTFVNGHCHAVDAMILATGYKQKYPFLHESITGANAIPLLYRKVFSVDSDTAAFVGAVNVQGPYFPVFEMQARWCAAVFSGQNCLPKKEDRKKEAQAEQRVLLDAGQPLTLVQYISYMQMVSRQLHSTNKWNVLAQNPFSYFFEPVTANQYVQ